MKFEDLNLHSETIRLIHNTNQDETNPFQQSVLSAVKSERDLVLKAGENEEALGAIAIAAIDQAHRAENEEGTKALILLSDAEKVKRAQELIKQLKPDADCALVETGGDEEAQSKTVEAGHKIVLADPTQLQTILRENRYIFRHIGLLGFVQFDEMASAGLGDTLANIKKRVLCDCVSVIVTESYDDDNKQAVQKLANKPMVDGFGPPPPPQLPAQLKQNYIKVPPRMKISTLLAHLKSNNSGNTIIFTDSKRGTDKLYRILKKQRMQAVSLHYKLSEERRAQRFANFTNGNVPYLLVSDIPAAELDVSGVTRVVNYDVPTNADEYRYRAALVGTAQNNQIVSLVSKQDQSDINKLQNILGEGPVEIPLPDDAKQKLKERGQKGRSNGRKGRSKEYKKEDLELPRPSFDQLKGGRTGHYDNEETGIVTFFKKLFS